MFITLPSIATLLVCLALLVCCLGDTSKLLIAECRSPPPQKTWVKHPNPVYGGGTLGVCFDAVFTQEVVHANKTEAKYTMYFSWRPQRSIAFTTSRDGIEWDPNPTIILFPVDHSNDWEYDVNRPYFLKHNNKYHMWYTGQSPVPELKSRLGYAHSEDGIKWERFPEPVLEPELPWERDAIMCTHVLYNSSTSEYRMWYSGGEKYGPDAIGHAVSLDGVHWNRTSENPIFQRNLDDFSAFDVSKVTCPHIVYDGIYFNMFYIGFKGDVASIGLARSKDGLTNWERHPGNPIIRHTSEDWDSLSSYKPYLLHNGTHWLMWYNGRSSALEQIGLATYETKDDNIYDFGFHNQDKRCKIDSIMVTNSAHMTSQIKEYPAEWNYPILIAAIADEKYINSVEIFFESFEAFGYKREDLGMVCASIACSTALTDYGIAHYLYVEEMCDGKLRCLISSAKMSFVADALKSNVSVFFFDLDVYFKRDPLNNISSYLIHHLAHENRVQINDALPVVHMIANYNGDGNLDDNFLNFGAFLIRPEKATILMFTTMFRRLHSHPVAQQPWDQKLFNDAAIKWAAVNFTYLPLDEHYQFSGSMWRSFNLETMKSLHMVCVEGAENKLLLARTHFGPFFTPEYYRDKKTVSISYEPDYIGHPELLAGLIGTAVYVARRTGRYIRLTNWPGYVHTVSLFDADRLMMDGIFLVEQQYWDNALKMHPSSIVHTAEVNVTSIDDLVHAAKYPHLQRAHDLLLQFANSSMLSNDVWKTENERFVCKEHWHRFKCLATCQGVHFR